MIAGGLGWAWRKPVTFLNNSADCRWLGEINNTSAPGMVITVLGARRR